MLQVDLQLGPYQITEFVGAGGMGEVYRARDTRLGRDVAIKVLPASVMADIERLHRFEQEARTVAALDHPNVVALYDVGTHEGAPYLVSEYLEGETLRELLHDGPLPQRKAIEYAVEIARGLAAAHDKGVVHRDLKPENVFLTRDGRVKILDFGLAKLAAKQTAAAAVGEGATASQTAPGTVMGTAGYMSPEQVRGAVVDQRSDIFSFGAILYEMLKGQPAFKRDSSVETMNAVLKDEPPELAGGSLPTSPGLQRIVQRCLEKRPEERFQSARDVAFAMDALTGSSGRQSLAAPAARPRRAALFIATAGLGLVAVAAGAFVATWYLSRRPTLRPAIRQLTFRKGTLARARFAPDGRTVVYAAEWNEPVSRLYSVRTDSPESQPVAAPPSGLLSISREGELAIALGQRSPTAPPASLARVPITGGAPRELAENIADADWSGDGTQLAVARQIPGSCQLEYPIGTVLYKTGGFITDVRVSPQSDVIAFLDHPLLGDDRGFVVMVDLVGHKKVLTPEFNSIEGLAWSPNGQEMWFGGASRSSAEPENAIYLVTRAGQLRLVLPSLIRLVLQDIASDGRALVSRHTRQAEVYLGGLGRSTASLARVGGMIAGPISRDGTLVVVTDAVNAAGPDYPLYLAKFDGSPPVLLGKGWGTDISPDNKWVLAVSEHVANKLSLLPTRAGQERVITTGTVLVTTARWFPDGRRLLVQGYEAGKGQRLYVQEVAGGTPRAITPEGAGAEVREALGGFAVSADGKYVAAADQDRKWRLYPTTGGESPIEIPGIGERERPVRIADGYAYVVSLQSLPQPVYKVNLKSGARTLFATLGAGEGAGAYLYNVILAEDGKHYAYTIIRDDSALFVVEGLR